MDLIWLLIGAALTIVPMWKLTERAGLNPMWALVSITFVGLIVLLWVLAFRREAA